MVVTLLLNSAILFQAEGWKGGEGEEKEGGVERRGGARKGRPKEGWREGERKGWKKKRGRREGGREEEREGERKEQGGRRDKEVRAEGSRQENRQCSALEEKIYGRLLHQMVGFLFSPFSAHAASTAAAATTASSYQGGRCDSTARDVPFTGRRSCALCTGGEQRAGRLGCHQPPTDDSVITCQ